MDEIVGRDTELEAIERWLDAPRPSALLLEGEPGIGKSTLWRAAVEGARERGRQVLVCAPSIVEQDVGFAALGDLLTGLDSSLVESLPPPQRRALEGALLLRYAERSPEGRALGLGLVGVLRQLSARRPVLVAIDDVQWLDPSSRTVLAFATRRLEDADVALLVARRTGEDDGEVPLELARAHLPGGISVSQLGPLRLGGLGHLVRQRLGLTLRRPELLRLERLSGGNPFFALELAPTIGRDGSDARLPASLSAAIAARLAVLDDDVLDALLVTAVCPSPTLTAVESVLEGRDAWQLLEPARDEEIVELEGANVVFRHPMYPAAVLARANPRRRAEIHRRLAARAETRELRAHHLAGATDAPDDEVAAAIEAGARDALVRGAPEIGAELAARSRALTRAGGAARSRGLLEAECLFAAGDVERGRELLAELADTTPAGPARAEVLVRMARAPRNLEESVDLCERALAEAGDTALAVEIGGLLAESLFLVGESDRATAAAQRAVEDASRTGSELTTWRARAVLAMIDGYNGRGWDLATVRRAAEVEVATLDRPDPDGVALWYAQALQIEGRHDDAREWAHVLRQRAVGTGDAMAAAAFGAEISTSESNAGRFREARELVVAVLDEYEHIGWEQQYGVSLGLLAYVDAFLGNEEAARACAEEARAITQSGSEQVGELRFGRALVVLELGLEHFEAARDRAEDALELLSPALADLIAKHMWGYAVEAHAALGELERSRELTELVEADAVARPSPQLQMIALRSRGLTEATAGNLDEALATLTAAVDAADETRKIHERGRTRLMLGRVQLRAGQRADARTTLTEAIHLLDESGALLFADQARRELARVPGRRSRDGDELTEAERRIAELVAQGRSNKEVAASLYLSVKTVEVTLTRIYRKLGVRNRAELAHSWGEAAKH